MALFTKWTENMWNSLQSERSNNVYYGTKLATTVEPLILSHQLRDVKNCKLRVLSNECCLNFKGQSIDGISQFSSLRHCLRPSKWCVRRSSGCNSRHIAKLRYPSEPHFRCRIQIMHSFDRSAINKRTTAWFCVDSVIAKVGKIDSA